MNFQTSKSYAYTKWTFSLKIKCIKNWDFSKALKYIITIIMMSWPNIRAPIEIKTTNESCELNLINIWPRSHFFKVYTTSNMIWLLYFLIFKKMFLLQISLAKSFVKENSTCDDIFQNKHNESLWMWFITEPRKRFKY